MSVPVMSGAPREASSRSRLRGRQPRQATLPFGAGAPAAPAAAALVSQARRGVAAAGAESDVVERFTGAYLSALRSAAAVLAACGRPHRGRAKPESVWSLLESTVPDLAGWAAYFAAHSATHASAQSGVARGVDETSAAELLTRAGEFLAVADVLVREQGESPYCAGDPRPSRSRRP